MDQRHLVTDAPHLTPGDTDRYLEAALEDIVANYPPRSRYAHEALHGLWSGPTGVAHLLLQVSSLRPDLTISGKPAEHWAHRYLVPGSRGHNLRLGSHGCGIGDEKLAYEAVRCAASKDLADVRQFISSVSQVMEVEEYPDEMLYGRAGTLYLLRMVRHAVPGSNELVDPAIAEISNTILNRGPRWQWHGRRYLGAVHGDIGIITQLVLTSPSLAPRVQPILERLLTMQLPDGNWPSSEESGPSGKGLVQFCHGAPGFVLSLLALRPHFPRDLRDRIDAAVRRGRQCIWTQGLLKKEPSLCHGIFGNALALAPGPEREHFLAIATPENVGRMKSADSTLFERADYGRSYSTTSSYAPSAAWAWLVGRQEEPRMLAYSDI
ncbi:hypothetical protein C8A03DRAFT_33961 [Achaetomium macrosporum]|uniref:Uncharacterized protein n=1 Tax=Achaetomium macrosporum TaxID=79813 RepID=A0AAN7CAA1_9PEZI|nr:hypothetical protein C8A03DRAFT_33961 [Achaetomium macrosporum]